MKGGFCFGVEGGRVGRDELRLSWVGWGVV